MNFNNFTIKSQEAIQKAVEIAKGSGNQAIEPVHLLKGLMTEGESLMQFLFQKPHDKQGNILPCPSIWTEIPSSYALKALLRSEE